jgi:RelA/SpoT family (p)ppGpp synthetase
VDPLGNTNPDSVSAEHSKIGEPAAAALGDSTEVTSDQAVMDDWKQLEALLLQRFGTAEVDEVGQAFGVARAAHDGVVRSSGEAYIHHPIAVAEIVVKLGLDHHSVMAALLHDVLEDTQIERDRLVSLFGEQVAHMVDGVSKLTGVAFRSKQELQAESFRKMLLAMATDIRVILIKLADRLHNMRTIGALRPDKQRRIGRETLDIYAPIAARLGMFGIKNELEDLGFHACYPMRARVLAATVAHAHQHRKTAMANVTARIETALQEQGIESTVHGREKHLYGLYKKMLSKQLPFQRVFDIFGLRIVVESVEDCYKALGVVHQQYTPLFHRFKDFIAVPKANGYRSLHTVVNDSVGGLPVEVQIRTREMDDIAESGVAAHWAYKTGEVATPLWLDGLVDLQNRATDSLEFVENVKIDLFPGEIYVFTPKGRIVQLPRGATPVDFAYAVHSDIGNACVSAMVDNRLASLSDPLESGQTVEITTGNQVAPSPMWLNSVTTARARSSIRHHLRELDQKQAAGFGERLLRRALGRYEMSLESVPSDCVKSVLGEYRLNDLNALYIEMGQGLHLPSTIAERLVEQRDGDQSPGNVGDRDSAPVQIYSPSDSTLHLSKCCRPIPGDSITGFISAGQGVAVHRSGCRNVRRFRRRPREHVAVEWGQEVTGDYEVVIMVHLANRPGALARVTSTVSVMNVNIENMDFNNAGDDNITIRFMLAVEGRQQLARIVRRLRNLTVVRSVVRES